MKNGWCVVYGNNVFVVDGKVTRGIKGKGIDIRSTFPYVLRHGDWINVCGELTVDALRARMRRGTAIIH